MNRLGSRIRLLAVDGLDGIFDEGVVVRTAPVDASHLAGLSAREAALVAAAGPKRQREFATARALAREALAALGISGFDLVNGDDRCPIWPEGVSGSVSHSDTRAVVAVARLGEAGTVGVDVEHRAVLDRRLWRMTLLPEEAAYLGGLPEPQALSLALVIFSFKEALYKAQYPRSREYMGFSALRVELEPDATAPLDRGRARCVFRRDVGPFSLGFAALGRYGRASSGEVVSGVRIPP